MCICCPDGRHILTSAEARVVAHTLHAVHLRRAAHQRGDHTACLPHLCEHAVETDDRTDSAA